MKKISLWLVLFTLAVSAVRAQDAGTQQQIDKLSGQIQDLLAAQEQQGKRLDALAKQLSELSDKVNMPAANPDNASRDDLKNLAEKVQEIDKKRQADLELVLKTIKNLGDIGSSSGHKSTVKTSPPPNETTDAPATPQKGYEYKVQANDTLSAIAKAYRDQGVKVTTTQILKANPKLDPAKLFVGQKIFIPDPNAK
jgi:LysM repeat protein